jgi:hypothetical protein
VCGSARSYSYDISFSVRALKQRPAGGSGIRPEHKPSQRHYREISWKQPLLNTNQNKLLSGDYYSHKSIENHAAEVCLPSRSTRLTVHSNAISFSTSSQWFLLNGD